MTYTREERIARYFRRIVGTLVLGTGLLGYFHSKNWLFATMFIGANLLQYSVTGWCPMVKVLERIVGKRA